MAENNLNYRYVPKDTDMTLELALLFIDRIFSLLDFVSKENTSTYYNRNFTMDMFSLWEKFFTATGRYTLHFHDVWTNAEKKRAEEKEDRRKFTSALNGQKGGRPRKTTEEILNLEKERDYLLKFLDEQSRKRVQTLTQMVRTEQQTERENYLCKLDQIDREIDEGTYEQNRKLGY